MYKLMLSTFIHTHAHKILSFTSEVLAVVALLDQCFHLVRRDGNCWEFTAILIWKTTTKNSSIITVCLFYFSYHCFPSCFCSFNQWTSVSTFWTYTSAHLIVNLGSSHGPEMQRGLWDLWKHFNLVVLTLSFFNWQSLCLRRVQPTPHHRSTWRTGPNPQRRCSRRRR